MNLVSGSSIVAAYAYDAFGVPVSGEEWSGVNDSKNAGIRFGGYQYDPESGYYYLNARMYDPTTARFLQEDTYRGSLSDPLSLNLYTYCHNDPVQYADPSGHSIISSLISTAVSIAANVISNIPSNAPSTSNESGSAGNSSSGSRGSSSGSTNSYSSAGNAVATALALVVKNLYDGVVSRGKDGNKNTDTFSRDKDFERVEEYHGDAKSWRTADILVGTVTSANIKGLRLNNQCDVHLMYSPSGGIRLGDFRYLDRINRIVYEKGAREAFGQLMLDVEVYGNQLNDYTSVNVSRFNQLVSSLVSTIGAVDEEMHFFRNKLNRAPQSLLSLIEFNNNNENDKWKLLPPEQAAYHMNGPGGEYNLKFISKDGHYEAVYDRYGKLVTDALNMGTYNYFGPDDGNKHKIFDVDPYAKWGNTSNESIDRHILQGHGIEAMNATLNVNRFYSNRNAVDLFLQYWKMINGDTSYRINKDY